MTSRERRGRPPGVTALIFLFAFGVLASGLALVTLAAPGGPLDAIWRVNPRGHEAFLQMGAPAFVLLAAVCIACAATAFGLFARKKWGYRAAAAMLLVNLAGSLVNVLTGSEPHAIVGVPVVGLMLWYLSTPRVRMYFFHPSVGAR
jgi:hypothetical protein